MLASVRLIAMPYLVTKCDDNTALIYIIAIFLIVSDETLAQITFAIFTYPQECLNAEMLCNTEPKNQLWYFLLNS